MRIRFFLLLFVPLFLAAQSRSPKREMRAAWIATVANIDWPSLSAQSDALLQQEEMTCLLDQLRSAGVNTVIFQARPASDAYYQSQYEPWSYWLTGKQGRAPVPFYDPLAFVIEEAHKRCMDVHVWLNPYRLTQSYSPAALDSSHIYFQHPEWFLKYGDKWYFNPGLDQTRVYLTRVVADIVSRYDVDAVHFDDYFYPYKIRGEVFPDEETFRAFPRGFTNKDDWRRNNVDMVIQSLSTVIKQIKPWVEFGISPFGVWRNASFDPVRGSKSNAGVQNYDDLYADILLWLEKGWIDYVAPQLYWCIGNRSVDYATMAQWWADNSYGKNLYIGMASYMLGSKQQAWQTPNELCRQLRLNRSIPAIDGEAFYSSSVLVKNAQGTMDSLRNKYFYHYALPPVNRNIVGEEAASPRRLRVTLSEGDTEVNWKEVPGSSYYVVYAFPQGEPIDLTRADRIMDITPEAHLSFNHLHGVYMLAVTSVNRYKHESAPVAIKILVE